MLEQDRIISHPPNPQLSVGSSLASCILSTLRTPRNIFGLFRQYYSDEMPSHDPEEHVILQDLCDDPGAAEPAIPPICGDFNPYPNKNYFLLGDWFWNHGGQKSRESFHKLLQIVGNPEFHPDDVCDTPWAKIDKKLGQNDFDNEDGKDEHDTEWVDEDAGWKKSLVKISVPFNRRAEDPGPKDYDVGYLYHRLLVSVIQEKLANPHHTSHFHYQPFELF